MTDILDSDTSWCPVCDCAIQPKRYTVPVAPAPSALPAAGSSSTAIKSSQTTRGKNGTIKARAGGLVHGTGRLRPVLNRANTTKGRVAQRVEQVVPAVIDEPVRTRTVIDPSPTPLYCSEECRRQDMEESWPVALPTAREVLDHPRRSSRIRLGEHPSQINPARASPPPPSPTLPPVPPNSFRGTFVPKSRKTDLDLDELAACIQEVDEHSDSSSATGTSFTASDRSPVEERDLFDMSNLYSDPPPPPMRPLPLHPHRPSAPVAKPGANRNNEESQYEGGIMMAARRLQALLASGAVDDEQTRQEKREREEKLRKEEARLRRWDVTGEYTRASSAEREKKKQEEKLAGFDPARWHDLVFNYASNSLGVSPALTGVPSTHRRSSDSNHSKRVRAPETPNRTQSALELAAKYPLVSRSSAAKARSNKSSASLAMTCAPVYGITSSSSSASVRSVSSSVSGRTAGGSALALRGVDPEFYAGKKLAGPRRPVGEGLQGKLLVPDVLLRPSTSLPSGSGLAPPVTGMRRSGSEANVSSKKGGKRSASVLGAVREGDTEAEAAGGVWHRPEEGSEDSRSSATRSTSSRSAEKRSVVQQSESNWSSSGPLYDVPQVPVTQTRFEDQFYPDVPREGETEENFYICVGDIYKKDSELSRQPIRELRRRRGQHQGRSGTWVEKEWEVRVMPFRKKLFLFGGRKEALRESSPSPLKY